MSDYPGIDPAGLTRLNKMGGPAFVGKMIDLFFQEAPERLAAARKAEREGDRVAIGDAAHSMKSSAQNFGAHRLSRVAEEIERSARGNQVQDFSALLNELEEAYSTAKSWLENQRSAYPS